MWLGKGDSMAAAFLAKLAHRWDGSPVKKAFLSPIQANLSGTPQISFAEKAASFISVCNQAFSSRAAFYCFQEEHISPNLQKNHPPKTAPSTSYR